MTRFQMDVLRLRDRVVVATDPEISDAAAMVDLKLANGHTHSQSFDLTDPFHRAEARVRAKAASLIGAAEASSLWRNRLGAIALDRQPVAAIASQIPSGSCLPSGIIEGWCLYCSIVLNFIYNRAS